MRNYTNSIASSQCNDFTVKFNFLDSSKAPFINFGKQTNEKRSFNAD